ncbi:MAG: DUF535 family protein [Verrucomicrobia bacterium]|nr:DUF535 family protein [Verrucomicrobiota bacterium]
MKLTPGARWRLAVRLLATGGPGWGSAARFIVRGLADWRRTSAWLERLADPDLIRVWAAAPELATRLQGPYLDRNWSPAERLDAVVGHHDSILSLFNPLELESLYRGPARLVRLDRPRGQGAVEIVLGSSRALGCRGELTLAVRDCTSGRTMAGLTFSFCYSFGRRLIVIGGFHSDHDQDTRRRSRELMKEMHGLRPKALAFWAVQELCPIWRVEGIHAVGDARAVRLGEPGGVTADNGVDDFCLESDGRHLPDGSWELPHQFRPRTREELKPSRRRPHERRYEMLAGLRPRLLGGVRHWSGGSRETANVTAAAGIFALDEGAGLADEGSRSPVGRTASETQPGLPMHGGADPLPAT